MNSTAPSNIRSILTNDDIKFIQEQEISDKDIFDATGMASKEWRTKIRGTDHLFAANPITRSSKCGHKLKTRSGHCAPCNPQNIGQQKSRRTGGFVYVAISKPSGLVKVGITKDTAKRMTELTRERYADEQSWHLQYSHHLSSNKGTVEAAIHKRLEQYQATDRSYYKDGIRVTANEVFTAPLEQAIAITSDEIKKFESKQKPVDSINNCKNSVNGSTIDRDKIYATTPAKKPKKPFRKKAKTPRKEKYVSKTNVDPILPFDCIDFETQAENTKHHKKSKSKRSKSRKHRTPKTVAGHTKLLSHRNKKSKTPDEKPKSINIQIYSSSTDALKSTPSSETSSRDGTKESVNKSDRLDGQNASKKEWFILFILMKIVLLIVIAIKDHANHEQSLERSEQLDRLLESIDRYKDSKEP